MEFVRHIFRSAPAAHMHQVGHGTALLRKRVCYPFRERGECRRATACCADGVQTVGDLKLTLHSRPHCDFASKLACDSDLIFHCALLHRTRVHACVNLHAAFHWTFCQVDSMVGGISHCMS